MSRLKTLGWAALMAVGFLLFSYYVTNLPFKISAEKDLLAGVELIKDVIYPTKIEANDSVMLINVTYDKVMIPAFEEGSAKPAGKKQITDRKKLIEFLSALKEYDNYKYILLDIFFSAGDSTQYDDELFRLIASMPRIIIPKHKGLEIADSILLTKAAYSDYNKVFNDGDFFKFAFLTDDEPSLPEVMFEDITGRRIKKFGPLYTDGHRIARNSIVLTFEIIATQWYADNDDPDDTTNERIWYNLGYDIIGDSIPELGENGYSAGLLDLPVIFQDKYIVVGAYEGDDTHDTFKGKLSGAVVLINAYLSLCNDHHIVSTTYTVFMFVVFMFLSYLTLKRSSIKDRLGRIKTRRKIWKPLSQVILWTSTWFGYTFFLSAVCIFTYITMNEVYDIMATSTLFTIVKFIIEQYDKKHAKKHEATSK